MTLNPELVNADGWQPRLYRGWLLLFLRSIDPERVSHSLHSFVLARRDCLRLSAELSAHDEALGRLGGDVWHLSGAAVVAVGLFRRWYRCVSLSLSLSLTTGSRVHAFMRSRVHSHRDPHP